MKSQKLSCAAGQRYLRRTRRTSVRLETVLAIPIRVFPSLFLSRLVLSYIISVVVINSLIDRDNALCINSIPFVYRFNPRR